MIEFDVSANLSHSDVRDVMNSNRMNSMSRLMERMSHTTNVNASVLFFAVRICRSQNTEKVKYQLSVAIIFEDGGQFSLSNRTHTFALRHAFLRQIMLQKFLDPVSY